jgi:hypothetical protein
MPPEEGSKNFPAPATIHAGNRPTGAIFKEENAGERKTVMALSAPAGQTKIDFPVSMRYSKMTASSLLDHAGVWGETEG